MSSGPRFIEPPEPPVPTPLIEAKDDGGGGDRQLELQVVQSSSQIITINKPTFSFFTGRMPFLSPNQQCQSSEGKRSL